ncbi:MAG: hypothetical protein Q4G69_10395 [Planctomycetia bacterium]|nr:hypothetical protein [Planctomycetia bacterium]
MDAIMILLTAGGLCLFLFAAIYAVFRLIHYRAMVKFRIQEKKDQRSLRKKEKISGIKNVRCAYRKALNALEEAPKDPRLRRYLLEIGRKAIELGIITENHLSQDFFVVCGTRLPGAKNAKS